MRFIHHKEACRRIRHTPLCLSVRDIRPRRSYRPTLLVLRLEINEEERMANTFVLDPVLQQYCLQVQSLLEQNNSGGLTREEIGRLLEGAPPSDPQQRALYDQRVSDHANEKFDLVKRVCRAMFEGGFDGWGFIWFRQIGKEYRYHVVAKAENGFRIPILSYYPAGQIAQRQRKEFATRTRSATRIELAHVKSLENFAHTLPKGPDRSAMLKEVEERLNAVEIRSLRLAALNMDSGMRFEDFEQLANPRDKRLRLFAKQTKLYVEAQRKANKELNELAGMYEAFKLILGKDPKEIGEGAGKLDKGKP